MTLQELIINREEGFTKIKEYLDQYLPLYIREDQIDLKRDLIPSYLDIFENETPNAFFASVLSHLDILPDDLNYYLHFFNTLKILHGDIFNKSILDVACGNYPALVELIAKEIHEKNYNGRIDGIDPDLIINELPGLEDTTTLYKSMFTKETNIDSYDLLVGTFPCQSTESIIRKACREEKPMSIIPCGCIHPIDGKTFSCTMEYIHYIYRILDREKSSEFIFYPDIINSLREPIPILSLVRR